MKELVSRTIRSVPKRHDGRFGPYGSLHHVMSPRQGRHLRMKDGIMKVTRGSLDRNLAFEAAGVIVDGATKL